MTSNAIVRQNLATAYLAERAARNPKLVPPRTHTNSTVRESYSGLRMESVRHGADQHLQHHSLGDQAQIKQA